MSNKPRVITVGYGRHFFSKGNLERNRMLNCAKETESLDVIIFTFAKDGFSKDEAGEGLVFHPTNSSSKVTAVWDAFKIASSIIKKETNKEEVIVSTQDPFEAGLVGYLLKKKFKVHFSVQEHADAFSESYWSRESFLNQIRFRLGGWIIKKADTVRVVADRIAKTLVEKGVSKERIKKLAVAIDVESFASAEPSSTVKQIFPGDSFVFLWVGRFVDQKNLPLMINSFKKVHDKNKQARLLMVGSGPKEKDIKKMISENFDYSVAEDCPIQILPWSDEVTGLMKASDAYLLTSNYEGWARVLVEAMCAELPVVTTDVGCANEVVIDNEHGYVVPLDDETKLVEAMLDISSSETKYELFKHNLEKLDMQEVLQIKIEEYGKAWISSLK